MVCRTAVITSYMDWCRRPLNMEKTTSGIIDLSIYKTHIYIYILTYVYIYIYIHINIIYTMLEYIYIYYIIIYYIILYYNEPLLICTT